MPHQHWLFGDREIIVSVSDLLRAPVDVIVNPANEQLQHGGGLAAIISDAAGPELNSESAQLIKEYGSIPTGCAAYTTAGELPFRSIIHAVGPVMGSGDEQNKLEQAVSRSLLICETNDWESIGFPAISSGIFAVPIETCARAFYTAITRFWDARHECAVNTVHICLTERHYSPFIEAFKPAEYVVQDMNNVVNRVTEDKEEVIGIVDLSDAEIELEDDDEMNDWFK